MDTAEPEAGGFSEIKALIMRLDSKLDSFDNKVEKRIEKLEGNMDDRFIEITEDIDDRIVRGEEGLESKIQSALSNQPAMMALSELEARIH